MPFTTSAPIPSVSFPLLPRSWFCAVLFFLSSLLSSNFSLLFPHIPLQLAELVTTTTSLGHPRQRRRPLLSLPLVFLAQQQWPLRHSHERSTQASLFVAVFVFFVSLTIRSALDNPRQPDEACTARARFRLDRRLTYVAAAVVDCPLLSDSPSSAHQGVANPRLESLLLSSEPAHMFLRRTPGIDAPLTVWPTTSRPPRNPTTRAAAVCLFLSSHARRLPCFPRPPRLLLRPLLLPTVLLLLVACIRRLLLLFHSGRLLRLPRTSALAVPEWPVQLPPRLLTRRR